MLAAQQKDSCEPPWAAAVFNFKSVASQLYQWGGAQGRHGGSTGPQVWRAGTPGLLSPRHQRGKQNRVRRVP